MLKIRQTGDFKKTERFFNRISNREYLNRLHQFGAEGVAALASATPVDSGLTASAWNYELVKTARGMKIAWTNSHVVDGVPIAIVIQYGHGTRNGGYVQGRDYINPAIQPIFDKLADAAWKEVIRE